MNTGNTNWVWTLLAWSYVAQLETLAFGTHYVELVVFAGLWSLPAVAAWRAMDSGHPLGVTV